MMLRADGYEVDTLRLGGDTPAVPEGASLVVVAAPTAPLSSSEVHALRDYAESGGKLMILPSLHWRQGETRPLDLNLGPLLDHFEISLGDRLLVEDENRSRRELVQALTVTEYDPEHPATRPLSGGDPKPVIFVTARQVLAGGENARVVARTTATTIEKHDVADIWDTERYRNLLRYRRSLFDPDKDTRGPFPVVVVSEVPGRRPGTTSRAVVAGTHNFASNMGLLSPLYNKDLFMNLVNWLTARERHMGIAAKHPRAVAYHVRPSTRRTVFLLVMVVMPLIAVLVGAGVWLTRRT
jgi:hypothetical protein